MPFSRCLMLLFPYSLLLLIECKPYPLDRKNFIAYSKTLFGGVGTYCYPVLTARRRLTYQRSTVISHQLIYYVTTLHLFSLLPAPAASSNSIFFLNLELRLRGSWFLRICHTFAVKVWFCCLAPVD